MVKIVLNPVAGTYDVTKVNENFDKIEAALNNEVLYRNNVSKAPNSISVDLDMNGKRLFNLPVPVNLSEPARLQDLQDVVDGVGFGRPVKKKIYLIGITGQSNAVGSNTGGPNPASPDIHVWDGVTNDWGSSDYLEAPFSRSAPHGNSGNNNMALALAHRLVDEEGAEVYIVYDAVGGRPIEDWMGTGVTSVRYAGFKAKMEAALASDELVDAEKTQLDFLIYAQGEENALTDTFLTYGPKISTLDGQFRAETWMGLNTPMFIMGMSGLHTRYQVGYAQLDYCENGNRNCIYVNSAGLKTYYDIDPNAPGADYTHWTGDSLWDFGYERVWYATKDRGMTHRAPISPFYSRGSGPWRGQPDAIFLGKSIISIESSTNAYSLNGAAASGSITWGFECSADGNYTMAGGYQVVTGNLCNYSLGWGRDIVFSDAGDYSGAFGFQNTVNNTYQLVAGRGNSPAHSAETALGTFTEYTTVQTDPVIFQVGMGTSTSQRKNALAVRNSGIVEMKQLPVYADNAAATAGGLIAGQLYRTATGVLMVRF